jgi:hypothetical protein
MAARFGSPLLVGLARLPRARLEADAEQWSGAEAALLAAATRSTPPTPKAPA